MGRPRRDYLHAAAVVVVHAVIAVGDLATFLGVARPLIIREIAVFAVGDGDGAVWLGAWGLRHECDYVFVLGEVLLFSEINSSTTISFFWLAEFSLFTSSAENIISGFREYLFTLRNKPIGASPRRDYRSDDGTILAHNILQGFDWNIEKGGNAPRAPDEMRDFYPPQAS